MNSWGCFMKRTTSIKMPPLSGAGVLLAFGLLLAFPAICSSSWEINDALATGGIPTPTPDPLAPPDMPEAPTQLDVGRSVYFYHCMPCHGDRGQGLTDEWRETWVKDHQNCWARGCHAGKPGDEGFPLPKVVPPVSGSAQAIAHFATARDLFDFLRQAHPPQSPGSLSEDDCWALTHLLWSDNGRLLAAGAAGAEAAGPAQARVGISVALPLLVVFLLYLGWRGTRRSGRAAESSVR